MQNVGIADRIIRIILAVVFIILGFTLGWGWFIPAAIALVTGVIGWCGLYSLFGWKTTPKTKTATKPSKKKS